MCLRDPCTGYKSRKSLCDGHRRYPDGFYSKITYLVGHIVVVLHKHVTIRLDQVLTPKPEWAAANLRFWALCNVCRHVAVGRFIGENPPTSSSVFVCKLKLASSVISGIGTGADQNISPLSSFESSERSRAEQSRSITSIFKRIFSGLFPVGMYSKIPRTRREILRPNLPKPLDQPNRFAILTAVSVLEHLHLHHFFFCVASGKEERKQNPFSISISR